MTFCASKKSISAVLAASLALSLPTIARADDSPMSPMDRSNAVNPNGINPEPSQPPSGSLPSGTTPYTNDQLRPQASSPNVSDVPVTPPQTTPPAPPAAVPNAVSTTTTTSAVYEENATAEKSKWEPNRPMAIIGSALFLGSYGASVIVGAASGNDSDKKLFIPVAGPWIDMGDRRCGFGQCGATSDFENSLLVASGVAQAAGIGLAVASLFVPNSSNESRVAKTPPKPELHVLPTSVGRAAPGIGAVGTF